MVTVRTKASRMPSARNRAQPLNPVDHVNKGGHRLDRQDAFPLEVAGIGDLLGAAEEAHGEAAEGGLQPVGEVAVNGLP